MPSPTHQEAINIAFNGYLIHPVFNAVNGVCACGNPDCGKSTGKHPRINGWPGTSSKNLNQVLTWFNQWPDSNIGIPTGEINGFLVVDVDGELGRQSLSKYPDFPVTPTVITGRDGGGIQYYLKCPEGITVKSRTGFLPGVDIRGEGGQVVAPPSIHYSGRQYTWKYRLGDVSLAPCDEWLLDLFKQADLRDAEKTIKPAPNLNKLGRATQADLDEAGKNANGFLKKCDGAEWDGYSEWMSTAVWANGLDRAFGTTMFYEKFCEASHRHPKYHRRDDTTLDKHFPTLAAVRLDFEGLGLEYDIKRKQAVDPSMPDPFNFNGFTGAKVAAPSPVPNKTAPEPEPAPWEVEPAAEAVGEVPFGPETEPQPEPAAEPEKPESILDKLFWHADELKNQPLPEWLDKPILIRNSIAFVVGDTGTYKSFFAVDRALEIAQTERVAYIAGEGHYATRVEAWRKYHNKNLGQAYFSKRSLQPANLEQLPIILQAMRELMPTLIVIDTLNRAAIGLNENDQRDMGLFIEACTQLREVTGACVLIIHHTNRGGTERGSSAIKDGADTFIKFTKEDNLVKVECEKQKDRANFDTFYLETELVTLPELVYSDGETADSLVIKRAVSPTDTNRGGKVSGNMKVVLEKLALEVFRETGATGKRLLESLSWETGGKRAEMYKILSRLIESGYITQDKKGEPYKITDAGLDLFSSKDLWDK